MPRAISARHRSPWPEERIYTVREAACLADLCVETIEEALQRGELAGEKRHNAFSGNDGKRYWREWWVTTGADLLAWYAVRQERWRTNGKRGRYGYSAPDRLKIQAKQRAQRRRRSAVVALAREIVRQLGEEFEVEVEGREDHGDDS